MDQTRLDAIRARCEAATEGPWRYHSEDVLICAGGDEDAPLGPYIAIEGADATNTDMGFIAHARTDIHDMLAEIGRLTAEMDAMKVEYKVALIDLGEDTEKLAAVTADRDAWRIRAEAAEADLGATACCRTCRSWHKNGGQCAPINPKASMDCIVNEDNPHEWEWRGPEDGGEAKHDGSA